MAWTRPRLKSLQPAAGPRSLRISSFNFSGFAKFPAPAYLPTAARAVLDGPDWLHEIKYDGFRLRVERSGDRVRLITRGGYDWTKRYPRIVAAALKNRTKHFVIDGEAVILGVDGYSDFNALHSGKHTMIRCSFAPSMCGRP